MHFLVITWQFMPPWLCLETCFKCMNTCFCSVERQLPAMTKPTRLHLQSLPKDARTPFKLWDQLYLDAGCCVSSGLWSRLCSGREQVSSVCQPMSRRKWHWKLYNKVAMEKWPPQLRECWSLPSVLVWQLKLWKSCNGVSLAKKRREDSQINGTLVSQVDSFPFQRFSVDFVGLLSKSSKGHKNICTVKDTFTKWVEALPVPTATTEAALSRLTEPVFSRLRLPEVVLSKEYIS